MSDKLTPSEALYGFVGWLTCRDEAVTFSSYHSAAMAAELVKKFCEANGLENISREDWYRFLVHPSDSAPQPPGEK